MDGTTPNNNITYHLIKDSFSNKTFTLTNNELKVSIIKSLSDCGPVINLRYEKNLFLLLQNC